MIQKYEIDGTAWVAITSAGESGSCWVSLESNNLLGACRIYHSSTAVPTLDDIELGYPVYIPKGTNTKVSFSADDTSDIYYAIVDNPLGSCTLIVDSVGPYTEGE